VLVDEHPRGLLGDELQRVVERVRGGVRHPAVGELGHRPDCLLALEQIEADVHFACDLDAGEADLAVAHRGVHVADREQPSRLPHREEDRRTLAMQVVVEIPAVSPREPVRERLAVGRHSDHADHRAGRERDAIVHPDLAVAHLEQARQRRLHLVDQLAEARDERRHPPLDRAHVEDLRHERVARLGAADRHRPGRAVDPLEVDLRDEVVLAADLAGEAVVRLERDGLPWIDHEDRLELGPKGPDHVLAGESMRHAQVTLNDGG
jgi:hypothetical protein